jgi:hypothetical protein
MKCVIKNEGRLCPNGMSNNIQLKQYNNNETLICTEEISAYNMLYENCNEIVHRSVNNMSGPEKIF